LSLQARQQPVSQRRRWWTLGATTTASEDLGDDLLSTTLEVSQTQLLAQIADETSLDSRTMGILAFNGALLAANVAARNLLGTWWWTPLLALSLPTLMCLRSVLAKETDLGPLAITFYANYGGQPSRAARTQLLADLGSAFEENAQRVKSKTKRLRWTLGMLVAGLVVAALMISLDRPSTIEAHAQEEHISTSRPASAGPGAGAGAVPASARGSRRHP
jgi:hypothetical protein